MSPSVTITLHRPDFGVVIVKSGERGVNLCRARVYQHGYKVTVTAEINYNLLSSTDIAVVEAAIFDTIAEMAHQAATLRAANLPLFDAVTNLIPATTEVPQ